MRSIRCLVLAVILLAAGSAHADFPDKTIRIVVPYPPGGFNDTLGRIVAQKFNEAWGQPAVVENRPGGGTLIGTDSVAKAPADGYTLLVVAFPFAVNPSLYAKLPYDTVRDFLKAASQVWGEAWGNENYMITKPVTLKAMLRVAADLAGPDAEPTEGRVERWRNQLGPWSARVKEFRNEGFYERFPAKGQIERVAKVHRELAKTAGIQPRPTGRKAT